MTTPPTPPTPPGARTPGAPIPPGAPGTPTPPGAPTPGAATSAASGTPIPPGTPTSAAATPSGTPTPAAPAAPGTSAAAGAAAPPPTPPTPDHLVLIIGAGFSGIGTAIGLRRAGIDDFLILEERDDLGGSWHANRYPGIAVDISAFSYSFASDPSPTWTRLFPPGHELKDYADHIADTYDLRPRLRLDSRVAGATYHEHDHLWQVHLADGTHLTARFLVCATGWLTQPKTPAIPGLDRFKGDIVHTARWDPAPDLDDRTVAVIGTGASGVQIVPELAPRVEHLHVYQRTPIWLLPKPDLPLPTPLRRLFRRAPWTQRAVRRLTDTVTEVGFVLGMVHYRRFPYLVRAAEAASKHYLRRQVNGDPELVRKLTPAYRVGCKRPSLAKDYWRTFTRENVDLVTEPIEEITETGIRTTDGREERLDAIVLATGFHVLDNLPPFPLHGRGGRDLAEFWRTERFQSYEGTSVKGYPNLWFIVGPYSFTGGSWFGMIDYQVTHALRVITEARRRGATEAAIRPEKHDASFTRTLRRMRGTVFLDPSCRTSNTYYLDEHGDAPAVRPASTFEAARRARRFDLDDYRYAP